MKFAVEELEAVAGEFIKNRIGINIIEIAGKISRFKKRNKPDKNTFDERFAFKKTLDLFREKLGEIAEKKTILIVVDELDRCAPTYELIKHN